MFQLFVRVPIAGAQLDPSWYLSWMLWFPSGTESGRPEPFWPTDQEPYFLSKFARMAKRLLLQMFVLASCASFLCHFKRET